MQPTKTDIAQIVASDQRPSGVDGCSNYDRVVYIASVFECESFDIDAEWDFTGIIQCMDLDMVEACKHIAILQLQYLKECGDYGLIDLAEVSTRTAFLTLAIQKMNWHLHHLGMGRKTPPFPFIH